MGSKTWETCSEADSRRCVAAWQWLQVGRPAAIAHAARCGEPRPKLIDALLTRLIRENMVLQGCDDRMWVSLGNALWAALLYPLDVQCVRPDGLRCFVWRTAEASVEFAHVVNPSHWKVASCISFCMAGVGILFQETEPPRPLLEAALQGSSHQLSQGLLQQVISCLNIDMGARMQRSREALLRIIIDFVFNGRDGQAELCR